MLSPTNPLGIKAGGEGGTTPALAVVINAIVDALSDLRRRDIEMPATPHAIWRAIQNSREKSRTGWPRHNTGASVTPTFELIAFPGAPNLPIFVAQEKDWFEKPAYRST